MIQDILAGYQETARSAILEDISHDNKTLVIKSPTGSGKTVIMLSVIDKYLKDVDGDVVFVWLCPGTGDLEEQSRRSMEQKCPDLETRTISDVLSTGFEKGCTYFLNWETICKRTNKALKDSERKNLYKRISTAHKNGIVFITVIDEEHQNDTSKAQEVIDALAAKKELRMSATAKKRPTCNFYEINEEDVISAGFISKAIVINEDLNKGEITNENETKKLIDLALAKREAIAKEYDRLLSEGKVHEKINPLILIQFPSMSDSLITYVEDYLATKGINYDNLLAKWMADDKINTEFDPDWDIQDNIGFPIILLMKQAISTGWDCPRAKILVKLRDNMDEDFEIQTIGRIRRMPERKHYGIDLLDYCYLYTLDSKYVESVKQSTGSLYELVECHLKDEAKSLTLTKELKHSEKALLNTRDILDALYKYYDSKLSLGNVSANILKMKDKGYVFDEQLIRNIKKGTFGTLKDIVQDENSANTVEVKFDVDKTNNFPLLNAQTRIASHCDLDVVDVAKLLRRLFKKAEGFSKKVLSLPHSNFYSFVVNNQEKLKDDFEEAQNGLVKQTLLHIDPNTAEFKIPEVDKLKSDPYCNHLSLLSKNVYKEYNERMIAGGLRSKSEKMFEYYCEDNKNVEWVYKNGDSGAAYFSVTYVDRFGKEWLFFPDYIIKLTDGSIYIIEAKGGEKMDGTTLNIDKKTENKFESFKAYAAKHPEIKWGFIRNYDEKLYFNNTEFVSSMNNPHWIPLKEVF